MYLWRVIVQEHGQSVHIHHFHAHHLQQVLDFIAGNPFYLKFTGLNPKDDSNDSADVWENETNSGTIHIELQASIPVTGVSHGLTYQMPVGMKRISK